MIREGRTVNKELHDKVSVKAVLLRNARDIACELQQLSQKLFQLVDSIENLPDAKCKCKEDE